MLLTKFDFVSYAALEDDWAEKHAALLKKRQTKNRAHRENSVMEAVFSVRYIVLYKVMVYRRQCMRLNVVKNWATALATMAHQLHARPKLNMLHLCSPKIIKDRGDMSSKSPTKAISHKPLR